MRTASIVKKGHFVLAALDHSMETDWPPLRTASAQTTILGLTEGFICSHGIPLSMAADQGTHFTAGEVGQRGHADGTH